MIANFQYSVELRRAADGMGLGKREVPESEIEPCREQLIFSAQRKGQVPADASNVVIREDPVFDGQRAGEITGLSMSIGDGPQQVAQQYGRNVFQSFVDRLSLQMVAEKQVEAVDQVIFDVFARAGDSDSSADGVVARVQRDALALMPGNLEAFYLDARAIQPLCDTDHPVFIMDTAFDQAHSYSWKGRDKEGGAWLVGNLYQQREPVPEIFGVIHSVIEARGAQHEKYSLDLSPESFSYVQSQLNVRRERMGRKGELVLGFMHSHPFLPSILDGKEACPSCPLQPECNLTSSFFSSKDAQFHGAVFGRAPYAVELVVGLTPREEFDLKMFCLEGRKFRERGYHRRAEEPALARA